MKWPWTKRYEDLNEEIRAHIEMSVRERVERGESPDAARAAARREFGNVGLVKETTRDAWGWVWLESFFNDVRHTVRSMRLNPGFAAVVIATMALGIGANTAIFTLVNAVMMKTLPVAAPQQLYRLGDNNDCCDLIGMRDSWALFSYPLYKDLRDHTPEFAELAAFQASPMNLSVRRSGSFAPASALRGEFVSGNYFKMFGVEAAAGRALTPEDDTPAARPVAVMNYSTWKEKYGLDPSVVGGAYTLDGMAFTVVGVTPPDFFGDTLRADPPDFWFPLATEPLIDGVRTELDHPSEFWLYAIGRLKPGAQPARVQAELTTELQRSMGQWVRPNDYHGTGPDPLSRQHITLTPGAAGVDKLESEYASGLHLLELISALVLLIACANIANLLLARGAANKSQVAIRVTLGAPRGRVIRQALTESIAYATLGGIAGLAVGMFGTRMILLIAFRGAQIVPIDPAPSMPVFGFALLLSVATGVLFGLAPAWINARTDPAEALRGAGRSTSDRTSLARKSLVVLQVALSVALLASAGLLTQSLRKLQDQQFGFQPNGRLIVSIDPVLAGYTPDRLNVLYRQIVERLGQVPGVKSTGLAFYSPMRGMQWGTYIYIEGRATRNDSSNLDRVSANYFDAIGTRLLRGRVVDEADVSGSQDVAVVNQTFVRKFFPDRDPIGQHFSLQRGAQAEEYEIVGIVEDAKYQDGRAPARATAFMPLLQVADPVHDTSIFVHDIVLRVAGRPETYESAVRQALGNVDPNLTVLKMLSLDEQVARNFNQERLIARLTELFALLAVALACVGLYGVTAYSVARRTNEIGIRVALGASRANVLNMVLRGAFVQIVAGLLIGVPLAVAGARVMGSLLYDVSGDGPAMIATAAVILSTCALVAALVPARRATRVDPMVALRYE